MGLVNRDNCRQWGDNSRLDTLQAAILLVSLRYLEAWTEARIANARRYNEGLAGVVEVPDGIDSAGSPGGIEGAKPSGNSKATRAVYHTYVVRADRRDELRDYLAEAGIETKIHYPVPIHLQTAAGRQKKLAVCERQSRHILSLPVHQYIDADDIDYVIETIRGFYKK